MVTFVFFASHVAFTIRHGGREGRGEHGGGNHSQVRIAARLAALGLRLAGRQWEEEEEQEGEEGHGRDRKRHGSVWFPQEVGVKGVSEDEEI